MKRQTTMVGRSTDDMDLFTLPCSFSCPSSSHYTIFLSLVLSSKNPLWCITTSSLTAAVSGCPRSSPSPKRESRSVATAFAGVATPQHDPPSLAGASRSQGPPSPVTRRPSVTLPFSREEGVGGGTRGRRWQRPRRGFSWMKPAFLECFSSGSIWSYPDNNDWCSPPRGDAFHWALAR